MESRARNRFDVYRDRVVQSAVGISRPSVLAGVSIGSGSTDNLPLEFLNGDGNPQKWFRWGRNNFDDVDAIFL